MRLKDRAGRIITATADCSGDLKDSFFDYAAYEDTKEEVPVEVYEYLNNEYVELLSKEWAERQMDELIARLGEPEPQRKKPGPKPKLQEAA